MPIDYETLHDSIAENSPIIITVSNGSVTGVVAPKGGATSYAVVDQDNTSLDDNEVSEIISIITQEHGMIELVDEINTEDWYTEDMESIDE